jgi:hypothetical protein
MKFLSFLAGVAALMSSASAIPMHHPIPASVRARQYENFTYNIQNYTNGFARFDFVNGEGGNWGVTWQNSFGMDFVVGKGYQPNEG